MSKIVRELRQAFHRASVKAPVILSPGLPQARYNQTRQIFNRAFQFVPSAIVMCENSKQVAVVVRFTGEKGVPLRVQSGGHDHEGECTGTDMVVIDLSKMNQVRLKQGIARIGPGIRFEDLTPKLAKKDVMLAHGTCATVCIGGFTMGGGWGPWTRQQGMCCESLVGATLVLGDGSIVTLTAEEEGGEKGLLWALKGGGGYSYGIVTELQIQTFPLPRRLIKFSLEWNPYAFDADAERFFVRGHTAATTTPTEQILTAWEEAIAATDRRSEFLLGTNLKVAAKPRAEGEAVNPETVAHNCTMYGYWEGTDQDLAAYLKATFASVPDYRYTKMGDGGSAYAPKTRAGNALLRAAPVAERLMGSWDRFAHEYFLRLIAEARAKLKPGSPLLRGTPLPPDYDAPAPHKITSRLLTTIGGKDNGHRELIESLTSPLVLEGNLPLGLFTYITLGAIVGKYYRNLSDQAKAASSFPYKDKAYTIQYQTWWNEKAAEKAEDTNNDVYNRVNRALDWMDVCRDYRIPNTSGAFISFKDSSVPTRTYFAESYDELVRIKRELAKDPYNHFSSRKTII
jgi:hypothetical protein